MSRILLQNFCIFGLEVDLPRSEKDTAVAKKRKLKSNVKTQVLHSGKERDNICVFLYGHCYQGVTGLVFWIFFIWARSSEYIIEGGL